MVCSEFLQTPVKPKTKEELKKIIKLAIKEKGNNCDLNFIDVSLITDMSYLFSNSKFNGDISRWNVSNVKDMSHMFYGSAFDGNIEGWDVSNVKDMRYMFSGTDFNGDIEDWDVNLKICRLDGMYDSEKLSYAPYWYIEEISDSDY